MHQVRRVFAPLTRLLDAKLLDAKLLDAKLLDAKLLDAKLLDSKRLVSKRLIPKRLVPKLAISKLAISRLLISGLFIPGLLIFVDASKALARPAEVFLLHLDRIQQQIPSSYQIRLPSEILLGGPGMEPEEINKLIVRVQPDFDDRMTISLLTCESGPHPCLIGSFTIAPNNSPTAQSELAKHKAMSAPVTIEQGVQAYLMEGDRQVPSSEFSSAMWEQDGMIYKVSFLASERQNILNMARSMALQAPLTVVQDAALPLP
ncbi:MAG: hypothetical protein MUF49_21005 [Oculatellaceae cyanobacterium Prado106]|jgi:hypothetical protein|nr:hypothetical protein [Oculatellaceae cyanobacterium Prado106]